LKRISAKHVLIGSIVGGIISAMLIPASSKNMKNKILKRIIAKKLMSMVNKLFR
jgi:gas vesicle protein